MDELGDWIGVQDINKINFIYGLIEFMISNNNFSK
jgi:hypothetical protein